MGAPKLNTFVHVVEVGPDGRQTGQAGTFGPADTLPAWAIAAITNPNVWADDAPVATPRRLEPAVVVTPQASSPQAPSGGAAEQTDSGGAKVPPRGGAGSGREDWAAYATVSGVEVTDEMKSRDDIIVALDAAGIATK